MTDNNMEKLIAIIKLAHEGMEGCDQPQFGIFNEIIEIASTPAAVPSKSESGLKEELASYIAIMLAGKRETNCKTALWGAQNALETINDILSRHPTPPDEIEPLACLCDRKGFKGVIYERSNDGAVGPVAYYCSPFITHPDGGNQDFDGPTYQAAEDKTRAYLSSLPDVKEGK